MKALIVTGGVVEDSFTLDYIKREKYEVSFAVDSGLHFFSRTGLAPDYVVGDFDSVKADILSRYEKGSSRLIRLNPQKDDTDTEHALQMALDLGCETIHIFGATGSRMDHVLGNIQLLGLALKQGVECELLDSRNRIRLINGETILKKEHQFGNYVSLIPYTPQVTGLTLEGFLYPLKDYTMSSFYLKDASPISGVSNELTEDQGRITLKEGILVLVEARD